MITRVRRVAKAIVVLSLFVLVIWLVAGVPKALLLRQLSGTSGWMVYADVTTSSSSYQKWAKVISRIPCPEGVREFFLQYCESKSSKIVLRSLHPDVSVEAIQALEGLEIVNFVDLQTSHDADAVIDIIVKKAPNLKILHFQGSLTDDGLRAISIGLPNLEDLYLAGGHFKNRIDEFETGLLKLQGVTLANYGIERGFTECLEKRPDVKISIEKLPGT